MRRTFTKILIASAALFMLTSVDAYSQDPQFSQFYANPLYLNPAFAGSARCARFNINYRNQWPAISGNFQTYSVSYDQHLYPLQGGIGAMMYLDRAGNGTLQTVYAGAMYAYQLAVTRKFTMRFGLQASYGQRNIDWSKLTFGDQIDARYGFVYDTQESKSSEVSRFFDVNAGIVAYTENFYGGVAVSHMTQPNEGFLGRARLPIKVTIHAGAQFQLNKKSRFVSPATISPNILFQIQQNFRQLNIGLYATKGIFVGGLWYRNLDSFILLGGIQYKKVRIGYSYDFTISKLTNATGGAHEVSLGFTIPCRPPLKKFRTVKCPSF
jgi:type IX secretion system PorP/SprF family membrane protein